MSKVPSLTDREKAEAAYERFAALVRRVLHRHESVCLDDADDFERLATALTEKLWRRNR